MRFTASLKYLPAAAAAAHAAHVAAGSRSHARTCKREDGTDLDGNRGEIGFCMIPLFLSCDRFSFPDRVNFCLQELHMPSPVALPAAALSNNSVHTSSELVAYLEGESERKREGSEAEPSISHKSCKGWRLFLFEGKFVCGLICCQKALCL